jgi:protein-L-isoaspartate O-methyltransferase
MHVLDIATGTGLSAEAALAAVGPTGHVMAADLSPAMAQKARDRLGKAPNASVSVEDGHAQTTRSSGLAFTARVSKTKRAGAGSVRLEHFLAGFTISNL